MIMVTGMIMLAGLNTADFTSQVGIKHIFHLANGSGYHLNAEVAEHINSPRTHSSGNHCMRTLFFDELRNHSGNVVIVVGVAHGISLPHLSAFNLHHQIVGAPAKVLAHLPVQTLIIITR
jgi:hypothetical protein